jgi:hypothetical protein
MYSYDITSLDAKTSTKKPFVEYNLNFKLRGSELVLTHYGIPIQSGYKRNNRGVKQFKTQEEEDLYRKLMKARSVRRSREKVFDAVMGLVQKHGVQNSRFLTFTVGKEMDRGELLYYFNLCIKRQNRYLKSLNQPPMQYVATIEIQSDRLQKTGIAVPHIHMVVPLKWLKKDDFQHFCKIWEEVLPENPNATKKGNLNFSKDGKAASSPLHACMYMVKYMDKEIHSVEEHKKRYLVSKGIPKPSLWKGNSNKTGIQFLQRFEQLSNLKHKHIIQTENEYVGKKLTVYYDVFNLSTLSQMLNTYAQNQTNQSP